MVMVTPFSGGWIQPANVSSRCPPSQPETGTPFCGRPPVMDIASRVVFGGFWAVVTVIAVVGGVALLANGIVGGLLLLVIPPPHARAAATARYARYVFRGGRFRLLFW